jgi:uncharacterized membrane protein YjjB (DUF3815 family)
MSLAATGLADRTTLILIATAVLLAIVAVGAILHGRFGLRWAHWVAGPQCIATVHGFIPLWPASA